MSLIQLDNKKRNIIYSSITNDDIKCLLKMNTSDRLIYMRIFPKQFHNLKVKDVTNIIENNKSHKEYHKCVQLIENCFDLKIANKCKSYPKVLKKLKNLERVDDTLEQEIALLQDEYANTDFRLDYESLLLYMLRNKSLYHNFVEEASSEVIEPVVETKQETINPLQQELDDLKVELDNKKKEIKSLKAIYAIENISFRVAQVLNLDKQFNSYEEVYATLCELEQEAYNKQDFALIKKILSIKYAMLNLMGGINDGRIS